MSTKTPNFWEKLAEKSKVKHSYPPLKNGMIWSHPLNSSSAHNFMKCGLIISMWFSIKLYHWFCVLWQYCIVSTSAIKISCSYKQRLNLQGDLKFCHFSGGGSHVWPCFSQPFFHKNGEFLCSLERKFPEFSKTHPTFFLSLLLE